MVNCTLVAKNAHPHNNCLCLGAQETLMPKLLPPMRIAHVQLDERNVHASQGVPQRDTGMCQSARVDDDGIDFSTRFMDAVNYSPFVVGLECGEGDVEGGGLRFGGRLDVGKCRVSIYVRFTGAEEVQVWAVDEEDVLCHVGGDVDGGRHVIDTCCA